VDSKTLIESAIANKKNAASKKLKVAVNAKGILEIGNSTSQRFVQIAVSNRKSDPKKACLSVCSIVKEGMPKFFPLMKEQGLGLEHIHCLCIRTVASQLEDCDLKKILIDFIKKEYNLPTSEKLKIKKNVPVLPSKLKYLSGALNASLKYLEDDSLKEPLKLMIQEYLNTLSDRGFSMKIKKQTSVQSQ
jgi:hypothetical protein